MIDIQADKPLGDGGAEFLGDMDDAEHDKYVRESELGWKNFYKKVFNVKS